MDSRIVSQRSALETTLILIFAIAAKASGALHGAVLDEAFCRRIGLQFQTISDGLSIFDAACDRKRNRMIAEVQSAVAKARAGNCQTTARVVPFKKRRARLTRNDFGYNRSTMFA